VLVWAALLLAAIPSVRAADNPALPRVKDTRFSVKRGFYDAPFAVVISSDTPGASIRCTLDGSDPRTSSRIFSGPSPFEVTIDPAGYYGGRRPWITPGVVLRACATASGHDPSNVDTQSYLFLDRVKTQGNVTPSGDDVFWDTVMDPRVVNDPRYAAEIIPALQAIPILSIVMDWEDLFGAGGIHRGNNLANHALEKPCSIELVYPPAPAFAGLAGFQVRGGIKIQGGGGRWDKGLYDPKQSFTLMFQPLFGGPGRLRYPLFETAPLNRESDAAEYNRLILRAGHNKSWPGPGPNLRETVVYTRDEYSRASHLALSGPGQDAHGTFVHLYLNGLYWGLYNPVERPDHGFQSIYFGGDGEHYDSYKQRNGDPNGDRTRLSAAQAIVANPASAYAAVREHIDTAAYIDYLIVTWASGAADGPQWYGGNSRNPAGPVRFFVWDYEDAYTPSGAGRGGAGYTYVEPLLFASAKKHPEFRMELADRLYRHCYNDGEFTDAKNIERWLTLARFIESAVIGESARWGDQGPSSRNTPDISGYQPPLNRDDHWRPARDEVARMLEGNTARMIADLRNRGYYPSLNARAPLFLDAQDKPITAAWISFTNHVEVRIARDGSTGVLFYTDDGRDPRAEGGVPQGIEAGNGTYLNLTATTTLKARVRFGSEWSPLHVLSLHEPGADAAALARIEISEIMYHPAGAELARRRPITRFRANAGGADEGRGVIQLAANAPGNGFGSGDLILVSDASNGINNGSFTVERVSGRDVFLDQTLADEWPTNAAADLLLDGDRYEFLEIKNNGAAPVNLSGVVFTSGIRCAFAEGTLLEPGRFRLLAPERNNLRDRYPQLAITDRYQGALNNGGEILRLSDRFGRVFLEAAFDDSAPWPAAGDGLGHSLVPARTPWALSPRDPAFWRASSQPNGSPGSDDPEPAIPGIRINEILTHSEPPQTDAVELYNPTAEPVDLGGWHLTDDRSQPRRWTFPSGAVLPPGGFLAVYQGHYEGETLRVAENEFGSAFALDALGEEVYLFSPALGYSDGIEFSATARGMSLGRHILSTGEELFAPQSMQTLGASNAPPAVGPVVIAEILDDLRGILFLELLNFTDEEVALFDPNHPTHTWRLNGFEFGAGVRLPARGILLLAPASGPTPEEFRLLHQVPVEVPILALGGTIDPEVCELVLERPGDPVASGDGAGRVPYLEADRVRYCRQAPWPDLAALAGRSLERVVPDGCGSEPLHWQASDAVQGTPGRGPQPPTTPLLASDRTSMAVTAFLGTDAFPEDFQVWNGGVGTLAFAVESSSPLVEVTPASGISTGSGDRQLIFLEFHTARLSLGAYTVPIVLRDSGSGAPNGPLAIDITIHVVAPPTPEIGLDPEALDVRARASATNLFSTLRVFNAGTGMLHYRAASDVDWMIVAPGEGSSENRTDIRSHRIDFRIAGLGSGIHRGRIRIAESAGGSPAAAVDVALEVVDRREFIAFNDLSWAASQISDRITVHTTADGGGGGSGGGELLDYESGLPTGVNLQITGGLWNGGTHATQGRSADPGTDAAGVFAGKVDGQGVLSYAATDLVLALSGLDPSARYEVVLFGNRDSYADRFTTVTLEGAASFTNRSTPGVAISGPAGATARIRNGQNSAAGQVARYAEIIPGPEGLIHLRIPAAGAAAETRYYLNALMLASAPPLPAHLGIAIMEGGKVRISWAGSGQLENAPDPNGPWAISAAQDNPQAIEPAARAMFYRIRD